MVIGTGFRILEQCIVYIGENTKINIGNNVLVNAGPYFAADTGSYSKLYVADDAVFSIGDSSGFSNMVIKQYRESYRHRYWLLHIRYKLSQY